MCTTGQELQRAVLASCCPKQGITDSRVSKGNIVVEVIPEDSCCFRTEGVSFIQPVISGGPLGLHWHRSRRLCMLSVP